MEDAREKIEGAVGTKTANVFHGALGDPLPSGHGRGSITQETSTATRKRMGEITIIMACREN